MGEKETLYKQLGEAVVAFEEEKVAQLARASLEAGCDPLETILKGLSAGMLVVGELYEKHEYFVPEILMSADAMQVGLDILKPEIKGDNEVRKGHIVIGTIQGDVHDIGKNIVSLMLDVGGYGIHDLGRDVPPDRFVEELDRTGSEIVAISAMMTTTMMEMKKAVEVIRDHHPHVAIMLGGAPLTADIAREFGADGFAETAATAVEEAGKMLELFGTRKAKERD